MRSEKNDGSIQQSKQFTFGCRIPVKKTEISHFTRPFMVETRVGTLRRTTRARSHWIIEIADSVYEKIEWKGELCQPNDRYIEKNNIQAILEEGNDLVYKETRLEPPRLIVPSENS
jgi:hypothetical protein